MEYRQLGKSDLRVSAVSLGAWQWGMGRYWGYGKELSRDDIIRMRDKALELGVNFIDTAEVYGWGASESVIGEILSGNRSVLVASKYNPFRLGTGAVFRAADKSLRRLKRDAIDLYQIHFQNPTISLTKLMRNMERLVKQGKIRYIGVSNFGVKALRTAQEALSRHDVVSNQVQYSVRSRKPETTGLADYCRENKIAIISFSPLEQGVLTGKYTKGVKATGMRRFSPAFRTRNLKKIQPLLDALQRVSAAHGKSMSQGAINWVIRDENVVTIPGARSAAQVESNCGAAGWRLTEDELQAIERVYLKYTGRN